MSRIEVPVHICKGSKILLFWMNNNSFFWTTICQSRNTCQYGLKQWWLNLMHRLFFLNWGLLVSFRRTVSWILGLFHKKKTVCTLFWACMFDWFLKKSKLVCLIRSVCLLIYWKFSLLYAYSGQTSIRDPRVYIVNCLTEEWQVSWESD